MNRNRSFVFVWGSLLLALVMAGCTAGQPMQPVDEAETPGEPIASEAAAGESLVVEHALGEVEIPETPERVVALEWSYTEDVLALGVQPVGVADIAGYQDWLQIDMKLSEDVVDVGTRQAPNLETIAGLDPDLIIAPAFRVADFYEELDAIAPTVAFDAYPTEGSTTQYDAMIETFRTIAEILGREAEAETVLADMEERFANAQAELEEAGRAGEEFVLAQAFGEDTVDIRLFTDNAMAVEIVEQIGLENGWEDSEFQQYGFTTVSVETLPELGDLNFFYVVQADNDVFARESIAPVWESLAFVQNGHAYPLGGDTWLFGGPLSAEVLVDTVLETMEIGE